MKRMRSNSVGVEQGNVELFSDFATGGDMWTGSGARERRKWIAFSEPFRSTPAVHVTLSLWDMDSDANVRADIVAEKVDTTGFELVFCTWGDTRVARVRMSWMAIGELPNEDDFELLL